MEIFQKQLVLLAWKEVRFIESLRSRDKNLIKMNIIICGAGRVGFTIAKLLSEQGHSITVIDQSSEDIQKINDSLDVKAIVGKATYPSILEKANASETDMIIAVTRNDEINMLICQIAFLYLIFLKNCKN